jgi:CHAD domain-containing protein
MGYKLKVDEAFPKGIQRIVLEQVEKALDNLKPTVRNKDEAIHDARVCVKKIRAILRMIRDSLGNKTYNEEDTAYRDVARLLSKVRDSTAIVETLDKLAAHYSDQLSEDAFDGVRTRLRRKKTAQKKSAKTAMSQAAKSLRKVRGNIQRWPKPAANESIALGLKRVYKSGRKSFNDAYDKRTVETFHEWRKQVKHLLYQTRVLTPLWGRMMNALTAELDALGEFLSEHHDLAILRDRLAEQLSGPENQVEIEALVALIDQRQDELEVCARRLGARIYAESPGAFVSRSEVYWQTLRSEVKDEPIVLS